MPLLGCLGVLGLETDLGSDGVRCWPLSSRLVFKGGENAAEPCFDDLGLVAKSQVQPCNAIFAVKLLSII